MVATLVLTLGAHWLSAVEPELSERTRASTMEDSVAAASLPSIEQSLRDLDLEARSIAPVARVERRGKQLMAQYSNPQQRGRISAQVVRLVQRLGHDDRALAWALVALRHPLSLEDRMAVYECWSRARESSESAWQYLLPAALAYLEAMAQGDDATALHDGAAERVRRLLTRQFPDIPQRILQTALRRLRTLSHELPHRVDADPSWELPRNVSVIHLDVDWNDTLHALSAPIDAIAGDEGFVRDLTKSIRYDKHGPRVDVEREVFANLGTRVTIMLEYEDPLLASDLRWTLAIGVKDAVAIHHALERFFDGPLARRVSKASVPTWEGIDEDGNVQKVIALTSTHVIVCDELSQIEMLAQEARDRRAGAQIAIARSR